MTVIDFIRLTLTAIKARRMRSFLTTLGIAIGIAAVVLLTSIGEGVNQFVTVQFTQFGTTLVLRLDNGNLLLEDTSFADLSANDFLFV